MGMRFTAFALLRNTTLKQVFGKQKSAPVKNRSAFLLRVLPQFLLQ
jgi:hypothetical protein